MSKYIPKYITTRKNLTRMVLWTALYGWLFISIYQPFNSRQWIEGVSELTYFLFASLAVLVAMLVITVSRVGMCYYTKKHDLSYTYFGIWVAAEIVAMSLVYAVFPIVAIHGVPDQFLSLWKDAIIYTSFILLIPYAIIMLALILEHTRGELERLESHPEEYDKGERHPLPDMFNFYDEHNELKLSLRPDTLYYIEAADNYVRLHYMGQGKLQHFFLRNTLRDVEERFQGMGLLRTHRSYIVNFSQVKMLKRTNDGLMIDFDTEGLPNVPVSKTYMEAVMAQLTDTKPTTENNFNSIQQ
ncbi:MAG: LytTR family transcriptional regulator [Paludibacteraceae bacterium]|nr:LytTR family transcriptional regulator [Paludibacteraceae bacterium]